MVICANFIGFKFEFKTNQIILFVKRKSAFSTSSITELQFHLNFYFKTNFLESSVCLFSTHLHHICTHTLLPLLHLKELIVTAHLPGLHHDRSNIMESHVGFLLNPCSACSCVSLRVMMTCRPASARPARGVVFTRYVCQCI